MAVYKPSSFTRPFSNQYKADHYLIKDEYSVEYRDNHLRISKDNTVHIIMCDPAYVNYSPSGFIFTWFKAQGFYIGTDDPDFAHFVTDIQGA